MSDLKLFRIDGDAATELTTHAATLERRIQTLVERNLEVMLGVRLLASEHPTSGDVAGRMDSLGLDENDCPVIIEFKRASSENVINQGLFYLDWLMDHRGDFERLAHKRLGDAAVEAVDWSAPRLICIAADFNRYDAHAIRQINRNIELLRYRFFGDELLALEKAAGITQTVPSRSTRQATGALDSVSTHEPADPAPTPLEKGIAALDGERLAVLDALSERLAGLGEDVQRRPLKHYVAFQRMRNFACIAVRPREQAIIVWLNLQLSDAEIEQAPVALRDVSTIGHLGSGDIEATLRTLEDVDKLEDLIARSYARS